MWKLSATALALAAAAGASSDYVVHESRSIELPSWLRGSRLEKDAIIPVRIGLKQNNLDIGPDRLQAISSPKSKDFGKHMTSDEVHALFSPNKESVDAVRAWLVESGIDDNLIVHSDNKGWLALDIPVEHAERLFDTELYEFEHPDSGRIRIGTHEYKLPAHLIEHVDLVTPGVKFSAPLKKRAAKRSDASTEWGGWHRPGHHHRPSWWPIGPEHWHMPPGVGHLPPDLQGCSVNITPACVRALYDIPPGRFSNPLNTLGLYEQGDFYSGEDVDLFYKAFAPWVPQGTRPPLKAGRGLSSPSHFHTAQQLSGSNPTLNQEPPTSLHSHHFTAREQSFNHQPTMSQFYLPSASQSAASTPAAYPSDPSEASSDSDDIDSLPYPAALSRTAFLDPTFSPSAYLSTLRNRHQTLEDLRGDLRARSQLVSQELLDLVNGHYEAFLSLGGDLKGGAERVEGVRVRVLGFEREVRGVKRGVQEREEVVGGLVMEREGVRREVRVGRGLLEVGKRVEELERGLGVAGPKGSGKSNEDEDEDDEDDEEDDSASSDEELSTSLSHSTPQLRRLTSHTHQYILTHRLIQRIGPSHPFLVQQQPRVAEIRRILGLDLAAALRQAKREKDGNGVLALVRLYAELGAEGEGLGVLKSG